MVEMKEIRKVPIIQALLGCAIDGGETIYKLSIGDGEAAIDSLLALGYDLVCGLAPLSGALKNRKYAKYAEVNAANGILNIISGHIQQFNNLLRQKNSRSISYNTIPLRALVYTGMNAVEYWVDTPAIELDENKKWKIKKDEK
jgi:hypothetical protein